VTQLPNAPGVYPFRDASKRVLYIGRALNLRRRVSSYWATPHAWLQFAERNAGLAAQLTAAR